MALTLSTAQERLIQAQIDAGHYETPSQVIDAALDLLELGEAASPSYGLDARALHQSVLKGLAEAEAGQFVSQEELAALLTKAPRVE